jgi:hypothetical protein
MITLGDANNDRREQTQEQQDDEQCLRQRADGESRPEPEKKMEVQASISQQECDDHKIHYSTRSFT